MTTIALLPDVGSFMGAIASIMIGLLVLIYLACLILAPIILMGISERIKKSEEHLAELVAMMRNQ